MLKEIMIGVSAGAAILVAGMGMIFAVPSSAGAPSAITADVAITLPARPRPVMDTLMQNLAIAEQDHSASVRSFCLAREDEDTCRTEQYAANRALRTLYRQVMLRSDEHEARVANSCAQTQSTDGVTDWRGAMNCIVSARQQVGITLPWP